MSVLDILLIVAGVGYILVRRMIGDLLEIKGLLIIPAVLTVIGFTKLHTIHPVDAATIGFALVGVGISVVLGLVRGRTVHLGERNGELWMRYRVSSVGLWVLNLALKGLFVPIEMAISKNSASAADRTLLLSVGLGMLAESAVIVLRAMRSRATVVWEKGEDGAPHKSSPAFDRARDWVNTNVDAGARRRPWSDRDW